MEVPDDLEVPRPAAVPTANGIELNWEAQGTNGTKYLQLIVSTSAAEPPYLFYKEGDKYGVEDVSNLHERLLWMFADTREFSSDPAVVTTLFGEKVETPIITPWQGHTGLLKTSNPGAKGWGARAK